MGGRDVFVVPEFPHNSVPRSSQQERELKQPGNLSDKRKNCPAASPKGQQEGGLVTVWPFPRGRGRARGGESRGSEVLASLCSAPLARTASFGWCQDAGECTSVSKRPQSCSFENSGTEGQLLGLLQWWADEDSTVR